MKHVFGETLTFLVTPQQTFQAHNQVCCHAGVGYCQLDENMHNQKH